MLMNRTTPFMVPVDDANPAIIKNEALCSECGHCFAVCEEEIGVAAKYLLNQREAYQCIGCGQCSAVCPEKAITGRPHYKIVKELIKDPEKIVVFSTSPSVRVGFADGFGKEPGTFAQDEMVGALRALGADYVFDVTFSADLTIMEEGSELLSRILKGTGPLPQFTSCCPAWVKYVETYYPDVRDYLSSAKSPIGIQGPTIKTYFAKKMGLDPRRIVNVALTPCTAKKFEIRREEMNAAGRYLGIEGMRDMDYCITTRELAAWAREEEIDFAGLVDEDYDGFMGEGSGAGVIFGNTGGVMEAAVRTAYHMVTGEEAPPLLYELQSVRGLDGVKEAFVYINDDVILKLAVVYGTANAGRLLEKIKNGEKQYHFVEVMTCPGGCIGGGGQPKDTQWKGETLIKARIQSLYERDRQMKIRCSHQNEELIRLYGEFYGKPLSSLAEQMLHTFYVDRSADLGVK